jgi:hypothetical protein
MLTNIRRRHKARRQRAHLERVIRNADRSVRDELIILAQRQGLI